MGYLLVTSKSHFFENTNLHKHPLFNCFEV